MWSQVTIQGNTMKRIGVREFRDHATQYLAGDEVLVIERHGRPIGFYIPTSADSGVLHPERWTQALERLDQTVQGVLAETGLSEDELSRLYDLSQPVPDRPAAVRAETVADTDAPGR